MLAGLACLEVPLTYLGRGAGAAERLHVLLISTWIAALAIRLIHATLTGRYISLAAANEMLSTP